MKKLLTFAVIGAFLSGFAFAQEEEAAFSLEFSNELGSDVVVITEDDSTAAGFYDSMKTAFDSEKVFAGVEAKAVFMTDENGDPLATGYDYDDFDWWIGFRPFEILELAFSEDYGTDGSYLPVEDDNLGTGKLGSDGFTVLLKPVEGLTLSYTIPFAFGEENRFKTEDEEGDTVYFNMGFGAEYEFTENFKVSATVKDVLNSDNTGFGIFACVNPADGLTLNAGYGYKSEGLCDVESKNLFLFGAQYENDSFSFLFDFLTSKDDLYTAFEASYAVSDLVTPGLQVTLNTVYDDDGVEDGEKAVAVIKPFVTFNVNENNEVKVEADFEVTDDGFSSVTFPVYWNYHL